MTDELVEKVALEIWDGDKFSLDDCLTIVREVIAITRPVHRAEALEEASKVAQRISDEESVKCRDALHEGDDEKALRHAATSGGAASAAAAIRALIPQEEK